MAMAEAKTEAEFSLSVFCLMSSVVVMILHYLGHHYIHTSPLSLQLFTDYSTERNYIFLFCNCILAFLIANSAFDSDLVQHQINKNDNFAPSKIIQTCPQKKPDLIAAAAATYQDEQEHIIADNDDDDDEEQVHSNYQTGQDNQKEEEEDNCVTGHDEDDDDDDEDERIDQVLMNVDELNKKCEEFIRKMRKQIGN
ncbi:probable serine/threonine-protein kinase kinX [Impatiens glandulifera]|uniref:probable serine/threonine-protein kinase kinX n=1 Tax=Impatiens glandulifera TaxID=253017 RepID=UPI001FB1812B|nr:probable serine/threonine-protein kinase kinX [Impatiens glandulifera]